MIATVSPAELKAQLLGTNPPPIIDVRESDEFALHHLEQSRNVPLTELTGLLSELDPTMTVIFVCKTGARSAQATSFAKSTGLLNARSLEGGLQSWVGEQ